MLFDTLNRHLTEMCMFIGKACNNFSILNSITKLLLFDVKNYIS